MDDGKRTMLGQNHPALEPTKEYAAERALGNSGKGLDAHVETADDCRQLSEQVYTRLWRLHQRLDGPRPEPPTNPREDPVGVLNELAVIHGATLEALHSSVDVLGELENML